MQFFANKYGGLNYYEELEPEDIDSEFEYDMAEDIGHWGHWMTGITAYQSPHYSNYATYRRNRVKLRGINKQLRDERKKHPSALTAKQKNDAKKLQLIREANAIRLDQGLPLLDPADYGL